MSGVPLRERLVDDLEAVWAADAVVDAGVAHRRLQHITEAASYWLLLARPADGGPARARTLAALDALAAQQDPATGLFLVGDNVLSPPDTSFTINGLARLALVLRGVGAVDPHWNDVAARLRAIISAVAPALRTGGVHTPNHRWELASALARSWAVLGDDTLRDRAEQWLAEGVDVQADALYSERSPNYAAYVSNPSLTVLADLMARPDLLDVVHRNLHAHALLTDADGDVCTLQSRRQDQGRRFPVAPFEAGYRVAAHRFGCDRCAAMAERCAGLGGGEAVEVAAGLLDGSFPSEAPSRRAPVPAPGWHDLAASELSLFTDGESRLAVRAASDVAAVGRVCSGVNHEPTVVRYSSVELRLGLRLSRQFFGLGPFRADSLTRDGDIVTLREAASACYYQPLDPADRDAEGRYRLEFEGRFAAQLSFAQRARELVTLVTVVAVERLADGMRVTVSCEGPSVPLCLEIALESEPEFLRGAEASGEPGLWVAGGPVTLRAGSEVWSVTPTGAALAAEAFYEPGEAVRYGGGSDAVTGPRLAVAWRSGEALTLDIRRSTPAGP